MILNYHNLVISCTFVFILPTFKTFGSVHYCFHYVIQKIPFLAYVFQDHRFKKKVQLGILVKKKQLFELVAMIKRYRIRNLYKMIRIN
ncbi:hypothetical protein BpHYR1_036646 [Brachionus plicatilis]|uniref:Uncharacterized protein n=1 Tax=Brachionus plicatilis TaxID=10195 RepID=A0A3M7SNB8_BRAPC|nr:hypothetical protein BpHYR1_036646 [Brachionus plicatilis]